MKQKFLLLAISLAWCAFTFAQEEEEEADYSVPVTLSGSIQSDMMVAPQVDENIGATEDGYDNKNFLMNTYVDLLLQSKYVDAGVRAEFMQFPMPGFQDENNDFRGWGLPNFWAKLKLKNAEITAGTFYEQFGSGFILRLYEERSLGIDNSLLGGHVMLTPIGGLKLTALSGVQRNYWDWDKNLVSGADAEVSLGEMIPAWGEKDLNITLGASWSNVHHFGDGEDSRMTDATHLQVLQLPKNVNAFDVRAGVQTGGTSILVEYAQKTQDPNQLNGYTYGKGTAAMVSASYTASGLSLLAQAKRSENMGLRSQRALSPLAKSCYVNHLPAFTVDQTYALAALYPYATQVEGEWAFQGSAAYKVSGRFGPKFKVNYSLVRGLENNLNKGFWGSDGIGNAFFKMGDVYYQDLDVMYEQKLSKNYEHHFMYMYQQYNKGIIQMEGGNIYSNIFIYEGKWKLNRKNTLRFELQELQTEHESGNWHFALAELSVAPYLMFSLSDQIGHVEKSDGYGDIAHYYKASITGNYKSHRLMLSYGRTKAGYNCTGGVCRFVPASKGLTINYNYNF